VIEAQDLHYRYPQGPALGFANVHVPQGGMLLVHGASGAGKSTWLALLAGLLSASQGLLRVAGQDLRALRGVQLDAWRGRTIGFLPQRLLLSPLLSVQRNLALAQFAAGVQHNLRAIAQALAELGVEELAQRLPGQISGGQALRVALARAVLLQPQVILADEPTASLDDAAAQDALGLLRSTAQKHRATLVIATHDARVGQYFADQSGLQRLNILRNPL
jgi:putative ABC transport system ATP-binding protein